MDIPRIRHLLPVLLLSLVSGLVAAAPVEARRNERSQASAPAATSGYTITKPPRWVKPTRAEPIPASLPAAPMQFVLIERQVRLPDTGVADLQVYTRKLRQVNEPSGLEAAARVEVEFDPGTQRLQLHTVAVLRKGLRIEKLDHAKPTLLHREQQLEQQLLDGRLTATMVIDDLRVGDQVEIAYTVVGGNPVFEGRFVDVDWAAASTGPVALYQYRLLAPPSRVVRHRADDGAIEVTALPVGADGLRETLFRRRAVPVFRYDPYAPAADTLKDQLQFSEFADWADVGRWAERLFDGAARPGPAVRETARRLKDAAPDAASRSRDALDFVQKEVRYFGTEIGPYTHQPADAERVLSQRFGDCKDKVSLLAALLSALEVRATPVLVSQRLRQDAMRMLPSPLAFDHVVARIELEGGRRVLVDPTRAMQTGPLAEREAVGFGQGLAARADAQPEALPGGNGLLLLDAEDRVTVPDFVQPLAIESRQTFYGELAENVRAAKAGLPAEEFQQAVVGDHLRAYAKARYDGPPALEEVAGHNAVTVVQRLVWPDAWRFPDERQLVTDYAHPGLFGVLRQPDANPRGAGRRLAQPGTYRHAVSFVFAEPVFQRPGSERAEETLRQLDLTLRQESAPDRIRVQAELRLKADRVEAAEWPAYRDQLQKVWARMAGNLSLSALRPSQIEPLRLRLDRLDDDLRRGRVKATTPVQRQARARIVVLDEQLASGRLGPRLQAQAMVARGQAYDHVGDWSRGRADFERALSLDPDRSDAQAALAVNALLRGDDAQAVAQAERAIERQPPAQASRYIRSYAQYLSGRPDLAAEGLKALLGERSEVERSYGQVWLFLASRAAGGDGRAAIERMRPQAAVPEWPHPVTRYLVGEIDFDAALAEARRDGAPDAGRLCELYFFAAEKARLDGDLRRAREWYQRSIDTGVVEFLEYGMSVRQLAALRGG